MATMAETWGYPLEPGTFTTENPPALITPRWSAAQRATIRKTLRTNPPITIDNADLQRLGQGPNDLSTRYLNHPTHFPQGRESQEQQ